VGGDVRGTGRYDDEQIDITALPRRAPRAGAKEEYLFRLKFCHQTLSDLLHEIVSNRSHEILDDGA
jgi:hypothetical protein